MKKHAEISTYFCLKHRFGKKSAIFPYRYPNRNQVTTHPVVVSPRAKDHDGNKRIHLIFFVYVILGVGRELVKNEIFKIKVQTK